VLTSRRAGRACQRIATPTSKSVIDALVGATRWSSTWQQWTAVYRKLGMPSLLEKVTGEIRETGLTPSTDGTLGLGHSSWTRSARGTVALGRLAALGVSHPGSGSTPRVPR
jgi:hypothetical protein